MINHKHRTFFKTKESARKDKNWILLDASGKTLGRFCSEVAKILRGKHKTDFTPHVDCGDNVVVVNAEKIKVTGDKESRKVYRHYTGYIGGLKEIPYREMLQKHPERIIMHAVCKMLPKGRLGRGLRKNVRVFPGSTHNLQAQKPIHVDI